MFQISRTTDVRRLRTGAGGWLYRISPKEPSWGGQDQAGFIKRLETFNEQLSAQDAPSTQMLAFEVVSCRARGCPLDLPPGGKFIYLNRLRFADSDPIVTVETYLPMTVRLRPGPRFLQESLYGYWLPRQDAHLQRHPRSGGGGSQLTDANLLGVSAGSDHFFTTVGYNQANDRLNTRWPLPGDRNSFEVTLLIDTSI
jgi:hypothetical protein